VHKVLGESEERLKRPDDTTYKGRIELLKKAIASNSQLEMMNLEAVIEAAAAAITDEKQKQAWQDRDTIVAQLKNIGITSVHDLFDDKYVDQHKRFSGRIEFKDVCFAYPQRPQVQVLKNVSFTVEPGQTVALVGGSGSGKSTIVSLLQRFYEPAAGNILLDGVETKDIHAAVQRSFMGLVSQEPRLFDRSFTNNIAYGIDGDDGQKDVPEQQVVAAAKDANAWGFIEETKGQLEAKVGLKGESISGGQRQRVAIARAIARGSDVKVLLLDEATSALDSVNEKIVQQALDKASKGRTTIVVAHRLATIQHADKIIVMDHGEIVEEGTHQELLQLKAYYHQLVNRTVADE
jgi:ATP-binding cassette subfamily B (MDR/TAP) protein 1